MAIRSNMAPKSQHPKRSHVPVLLNEVIRYLRPKRGEVIVDGTFGAGGYASAILDEGASVIGIDCDPDSIAKGRNLSGAKWKNLKLVEGRFGNLDTIARQNGCNQVDGVVLDLGVSSMQLDQAVRGFSFLRDGPLDMRMDCKGSSAMEIVNNMAVRDLIRIIGVLGEEKRAKAVAHAIDKARKQKAITRTSELAVLVEKVVGRNNRTKIHPATRTFQGIRIFVNGELMELARALQASENLLREGGRLLVVSFHSLEDRVVKKFLTNRSRTHSGGSRHFPESKVAPPTFSLPFKGAAMPSDSEVFANPRARSSKLRVGIRTGADSHKPDPEVFGIPRMPIFEELGGKV